MPTQFLRDYNAVNAKIYFKNFVENNLRKPHVDVKDYENLTENRSVRKKEIYGACKVFEIRRIEFSIL